MTAVPEVVGAVDDELNRTHEVAHADNELNSGMANATAETERTAGVHDQEICSDASQLPKTDVARKAPPTPSEFIVMSLMAIAVLVSLTTRFRP